MLALKYWKLYKKVHNQRFARTMNNAATKP